MNCEHASAACHMPVQTRGALAAESAYTPAGMLSYTLPNQAHTGCITVLVPPAQQGCWHARLKVDQGSRVIGMRECKLVDAL